MPAIDPNVSDDNGAPDSVTPWNAIDLSRPGWGDDPYACGLAQMGGMDGLSPDLGQKIGHAMLAGVRGQDPGTVDPAARGFLNTVTLPLTTPSYPKVGLLGSLDNLASGAAMSEDANDDDQDAADPKTDEEGLDSVRAASDAQQVAARLRRRDIDYLDRYYEAANRYAQQYKVNPAFVLGLGIESAFGSDGTYRDTGDAFGMTGGSKKNMSMASSPDDNVQKLFRNYGQQIYGIGDDSEAFIKGMQGRNKKGQRVPGWKIYNTVNPSWPDVVRNGIGQMQRDLPIYLLSRRSNIRSYR